MICILDLWLRCTGPVIVDWADPEFNIVNVQRSHHFPTLGISSKHLSVKQYYHSHSLGESILQYIKGGNHTKLYGKLILALQLWLELGGNVIDVYFKSMTLYQYAENVTHF